MTGSAFEQPSDVVGLARALTHFEERSHQGAHHATQKAFTREAKGESIVVAIDSGCPQASHRVRMAATLKREGGEVVATDEQACGLTHRGDVEARGDRDGGRSVERRYDAAEVGPIDVDLARCVSLGVKALGHLVGPVHPDVVG